MRCTGRMASFYLLTTYVVMSQATAVPESKPSSAVTEKLLELDREIARFKSENGRSQQLHEEREQEAQALREQV